MLIEDENVKVEGTGSGFIWDKFGHIVGILSLVYSFALCYEYLMCFAMSLQLCPNVPFFLN